MSDHKIVQLRTDEIRYLRNDLEIARTLARLKAGQAQAAAARVVDLEAKIAAAEGGLPTVPDLVISPGESPGTPETVEFAELDVALGRPKAALDSMSDS